MTWQGARMRTCGSSLLNENMEDDTLHKNCFFLSGRVLQKGSSEQVSLIFFFFFKFSGTEQAVNY